MGLQAPSSFLKWMAEQNFYNILHAFLQILTTSFLHVEYRKLDMTQGLSWEFEPAGADH